MMRLTMQQIAIIAYDQFSNPAPDIEQAITNAQKPPHLFNFREEYFLTIYTQKAFEAREAYDEEPTQFLNAINNALQAAIKEKTDAPPPQTKTTIIDHHEKRTNIADIDRDLINKKITIEALVSTKTLRNPDVTGAIYICQCGHKRIRNKEPGRELRRAIPCNNPTGCPNDMHIDHYIIQDTITIYADQDYTTANPEDIKKTLIQLTDNLTHKNIDDKIQRGVKILCTGIVRMKQEKKINYYYLEALGIESLGDDYARIHVTPQDIQKLHELQTTHGSLPKYFAKAIFGTAIIGNEDIAEALIVALIGAPTRRAHPYTIRGIIHVMLLGEGATSKSLMLDTLSRIAIKGRKAIGGSATPAGLTATAEHDELTGHWMLTIGELPKAHKGLLFIDEADKLAPGVLASLHSAMESLELTITKAGSTGGTTLPCETTIMLASNPPTGRFDTYGTKDYLTQSGFDPPFLSRMGLIFIITDRKNKEQDIAIYNKIAQKRLINEAEIPTELFRKYESYAKSLQTTDSEEMHALGREWYWRMRDQHQQDSQPNATARSAEDIQRLAIAHARSELKTTTDANDMQWAINIYLKSRKESIIDQVTQEIDMTKETTGEGTGEHLLRITIQDLVIAEHPHSIHLDDLYNKILESKRYPKITRPIYNAIIQKICKESKDFGMHTSNEMRYYP